MWPTTRDCVPSRNMSEWPSSPHRAPSKLDLLIFLLILHNVARTVFSTSTGFLLGKRQSEVDGWVFLSGLSILLTQYNNKVKECKLSTKKSRTIWNGIKVESLRVCLIRIYLDKFNKICFKRISISVFKFYRLYRNAFNFRSTGIFATNCSRRKIHLQSAMKVWIWRMFQYFASFWGKRWNEGAERQWEIIIKYWTFYKTSDNEAPSSTFSDKKILKGVCEKTQSGLMDTYYPLINTKRGVCWQDHNIL